MLAAVTVLVAFAPLLATTPASALGVVNIAVTAPIDEGLRYESHSIFTLDLAARAVHVQVAIDVTNQKPGYTSGGYVNSFYFPKIAVPVLSEATNFVATRDTGTALSVATEGTDSPQFSFALITLKPALFYPQSQHIEFDYDLPGQAPRATGTTRVNDASSAFLAFGHGDPGLTSVQIKIPRALQTEVVGVDMKQTTEGDLNVYTADSLSDPDTWTAAVNSRDDSKLAHKDESIDGKKFVIQGWPDDQQWVDFVDGQLKTGLPQLKDLVGQTFPDNAGLNLTITETSAPYLYGYSGWYNPIENTIEIGDALDPIVVLHEISHTWFNKDLFTERWIDEGFADEFASRTLEKTGAPLQSPDAVDPSSTGHFSLNDWGSPKFQDSATIDQEHFGYNAAWTVLRAVSTEIGMDKLKLVIDAASKKLLPYQGPNTADKSATTADWHALLDLLEEIGGSKQASTLFGQFVVSLSDAATLAQRDPARAAYHAFVDKSGGWTPPLALRRELADWTFSGATQMIPSAQDILNTRDEINSTLKPLGLSAPAALQQHYESDSELDLHSAADEAKRDLDVAHHLVDAKNAVHGSHGVIGSFGLLFGGANDKVNRAERAFENGDATQAMTLADSARKQAKDATKTGVIRLVVILVVFAGLFAMWTWGRPMVRRRLTVRADKRREAQLVAQMPPAATWEQWSQWAPPPLPDQPPIAPSAPYPEHPPFAPPAEAPPPTEELDS